MNSSRHKLKSFVCGKSDFKFSKWAVILVEIKDLLTNEILGMSLNNHLEVETGDVHRMAGNIYRFFTPPSTLVRDLLECLWTERDHTICDRYQTIQQERFQRS